MGGYWESVALLYFYMRMKKLLKLGCQMNYFLYFCLAICPPLVGTIVLESAFHLICKQRRIGGNP